MVTKTNRKGFMTRVRLQTPLGPEGPVRGLGMGPSQGESSDRSPSRLFPVGRRRTEV